MTGVVSQLDDVVRELYGVDPDLFVDARAAAVTALKAAGDKALAGQVGALRKPTRSAWLVNLVGRAHPDRLSELTQLATRLAAATAAVDVAELREAGAERTVLVAALTRLAIEGGRAAGYEGGESARADVSTTLQAALADPAVLDQVLGGRLEKAQVYAGFGFTLAPDSAWSGAPAPASVGAAEVGSQAVAALEPAPQTHTEPDPGLLRAQAEVEELTARLAEAIDVRAKSEETAAEAYAALDRASQEVADLRDELTAAEAAELAARDTATALAEALHDARTAEQQLRASLNRAVRALPS